MERRPNRNISYLRAYIVTTTIKDSLPITPPLHLPTWGRKYAALNRKNYQ